jgi:hypothetical protein
LECHLLECLLREAFLLLGSLVDMVVVLLMWVVLTVVVATSEVMVAIAVDMAVVEGKCQ